MKSFKMDRVSGDQDVTKEALVAVVVLAVALVLILLFIGAPW